MPHSFFLYECSICKQRFARKDYLYGHLANKHHGHKQHQCGQCEQTFVYKWELDVHSLSVHFPPTSEAAEAGATADVAADANFGDANVDETLLDETAYDAALKPAGASDQ